MKSLTNIKQNTLFQFKVNGSNVFQLNDEKCKDEFLSSILSRAIRKNYISWSDDAEKEKQI